MCNNGSHEFRGLSTSLQLLVTILGPCDAPIDDPEDLKNSKKSDDVEIKQKGYKAYQNSAGYTEGLSGAAEAGLHQGDSPGIGFAVH